MVAKINNGKELDNIKDNLSVPPKTYKKLFK